MKNNKVRIKDDGRIATIILNGNDITSGVTKYNLKREATSSMATLNLEMVVEIEEIEIEKNSKSSNG